jgi:hypothetical protein
MRRVLSYAVALVMMALLLPLAWAQKKDDKDKDIDKNSEKMVRAGQVTGTVMNIYEDKKKLRVKISYTVPKPNTGAIQGLAQAQAQLAQAQARRDINGILSAQRSMAMHQANMITYEKKSQEVEIQAADDVVVRAAQPPQQFDEKGKIKKYTKKELDELRGEDKKLPGYKAEFGDIQTEMIVQLNLVKKKDAPKPVIKKGKDKDADLDVLADHEPQASMIIILHNPAATAPGK